MTELMNEFNAQMMSTPQLVQIWMGWMTVIFFSSVFFLKSHKAARYALASMLLVMPLAFVIFYFSKTVHLIGIAHLILWGPLLIYLFKNEIKLDQLKLKSPYGIWVSLLALTITVSLVFDIRDIYLVITDNK